MLIAKGLHLSTYLDVSVQYVFEVDVSKIVTCVNILHRQLHPLVKGSCVRRCLECKACNSQTFTLCSKYPLFKI